jgi:formylmethanofuran dehydrogenase subunit C
MSGGLIRVDGPVGECAGGPPPDATRGMTGGEIVVAGQLGPRAGYRMRRGMIVGTGAGPYPGHAMIAGTVVVCDGPLVQPGLEMKRGTILALSPTARHEIGPTFGRDCRGNPVIVRLIVKRLVELGLPIVAAAECLEALYDSYSGDRLGMGKGELFVRAGSGQ